MTYYAFYRGSLYKRSNRYADISTILVENAQANNLKSVNAKFKSGKFYVFVGPSGSGKTSLLFDVLYAEADNLTKLGGWFVNGALPMYKRTCQDYHHTL